MSTAPSCINRFDNAKFPVMNDARPDGREEIRTTLRMKDESSRRSNVRSHDQFAEFCLKMTK